MTVPVRTGWRSGWSRLAEVVLAALPLDEIEGIWQFQPIRLERREMGTAIISLRAGDRRRIWTARYALTIRGRERGAFEHSMEEVGSGPVEALDELMASVRRRLGEDEAPVPVPLDQWREAAQDGAPQS